MKKRANTAAKPQASRRRLDQLVRFLMEIAVLAATSAGIQLAFYLMDGPGILCGFVQGVVVVIGFALWRAASDWRMYEYLIGWDAAAAGESTWCKTRVDAHGVITVLEFGRQIGKSNPSRQTSTARKEP